MEMNGLMGGLYRICEWIMRLSVINVLWIVCSIPFGYLGLVLLLSENADQMLSTLILMGLLAPFVFFPATAAMYTVARKWVLGDVDVPLLRTFFRGYKDNYKQSMFGGLLYTLLIVIMVVNYRFYVAQGGTFQILSILFIILLVLIAISLFHFFSIMTHLHMSVWQIIKNSLLITIGRPITTLMIAVTNGFVVYISFAKFTFLLPFFTGSIVSFISFFYFNRMFSKVQENMKKEEEARAEEALKEAENENS